MTRVVYGVSGEGSGHSSRAREMISHIQALGHEVKVVSYGRGYRNLECDFDVFETEGLHIATVENKVSVVKTFTDNLARLSDGVRKLRELRKVCFKDFGPDCVITDFEPMTAYLAGHYDLPLITLDNQHRMRYMRYRRPPHLAQAARVTETVIRAMIPRPDLSLVTTFYFGEVTNRRTRLFPPILRRQVLACQANAADHILVYFTQGFDSFLDILRSLPRERFHVYGTDREGSEGSLHFLPPSQEGFLRDLADCKAVIATAGFTLITEALHLRKPYLALPMRGQFEQELNALWLEETGSGLNGREATRETVGNFLYRLPDFAAVLEERPRRDNTEIQNQLRDLLADNASQAAEFQRLRRAEKG